MKSEKLLLLVSLMLFSFVLCFSQSSKVKKLEIEADNLYKYDRNYDALKVYLKIDSLQPNNPKILARIGICYLYHIKTRALPYLQRAKELNYKEDHIDYYLARAYHYHNQFDKAAELYKISKPTLRSKEVRQDIDLYLKNCEAGKIIVQDSVNVKIENLGPNINTEYPEYAPIITADESVLIYTSERPSVSSKTNKIFLAEDLYISKRENGQWTRAVNIGPPINTEGNDASISLSMNGEDIYIYKSDSLNPNGGSIYKSRVSGDAWDNPVKLNSNINSDGWEPSISLSPNEDVVFFSSNRAGGFGGLDIYVSRRTPQGDWGKAKNLGPLINTAYDEDAPYMHPDGKTLYFSSKGHPSIGGFDIYSAVYNVDKDSIGPPSNLGYPINTADDEIFFIWSADGTRGYFSSTREDTYGRSDIYMVTRPAVDVDLILFSGEVHTIDNKLVAATITITDNATNAIVGVYDSTKFKEKYAISLYPGRNYGISVEAKDYLTYSENINIPVHGFHDIKKDISLVPIEKGGLIVLKNVLFEPGSAELNEGAAAELEKYSKMLKDNPDVTVEIAGHAFDMDSHQENLDLSEKRAQAVKDYLVNKGANRDKLRAVGYGDKFKVSGKNHLNTRTELVMQNAMESGNPKGNASKGYYYKDSNKALAESSKEVNNSIQAKLGAEYLIKKDEGVFLGATKSDIKKNEIKEKVKKGQLMPVVLKGSVKDAASGIGIVASYEISDSKGKVVSVGKTSNDGKYSFQMYNSVEESFTVTVQAKGYNYNSRNITVPANAEKKKELVQNFELSSLEIGSTHVLRNIYFDINTSVIKKESYNELHGLITFLKKNPSVKIEISGHTDSEGSDDYNKRLSQRRAEAVVSYLSKKGVSKKRLISKGYGEERPMASNDDEEEGRELNRRIEFEVLEK